MTLGPKPGDDPIRSLKISELRRQASDGANARHPWSRNRLCSALRAVAIAAVGRVTLFINTAARDILGLETGRVATHCSRS
jgi:hypothetical protein